MTYIKSNFFLKNVNVKLFKRILHRKFEQTFINILQLIIDYFNTYKK